MIVTMFSSFVTRTNRNIRMSDRDCHKMEKKCYRSISFLFHAQIVQGVL